MSGRKNPEMTEEEKEREYRLTQKRGYGEGVQGEGGEALEGQGAAGEVAQRRTEWQAIEEKKRAGLDTRDR